MVKRYAEPYQPTSSNFLKWSVMRGSAVAMMVLSRATQNTARQSAKVMVAKAKPVGYSSTPESPELLRSLSSTSAGALRSASDFALVRLDGADMAGMRQRKRDERMVKGQIEE